MAETRFIQEFKVYTGNTGATIKASIDADLLAKADTTWQIKHMGVIAAGAGFGVWVLWTKQYEV